MYTLPCIAMNSSLKEIYLSKNRFTSISIHAFISAMQFFPNLEILSLAECGIKGAELMHDLFAKFKLTPRLNSLNLSKN